MQEKDTFVVKPGKNSVKSKMLQKESRAKSEMRGTRGRAEHKGKARSTNKPYGGRMAM